MRFLTRGRGVPASPNRSDQETLNALGMRCDLTLPRDWSHFIYCQDAGSAETLASAVAVAGWELQRLSETASGLKWVVVAKQQNITVTSKRIHAARIFFEHLAKSVPGSNYDGWEASI